ncbi:hypothetical protein [Methylocystis parvus]|uniref:hypothetical protein n=1 Tax=Methylocystis parvus TaxID=134 RepID=UPI003C71C128
MQHHAHVLVLDEGVAARTLDDPVEIEPALNLPEDRLAGGVPIELAARRDVRRRKAEGTTGG